LSPFLAGQFLEASATRDPLAIRPDAQVYPLVESRPEDLEV